ncbi:hypothetical protein AAHE18_14G051600 [Arachis hypogaea]|uniref:Cystatin domain-containing protein n=1 Tax=Arachis hypogaea TaxID=3818 RepID=A0A444ZCY8_ARAHY|nr:hypothetical protein Ahy_B04g069556 [Arachis hypogaea]
MKTNRLITSIILSLFLVGAVSVSAATGRRMTLILPLNLDVDDPAVIEMAKFAIAEHNKRSNGKNLKLAYILSCMGFAYAIYSLELLANDGAITNKYLAQLLQTTPMYELQSFELAPFLS